jgi:hypothetical protein
LFDSGPSSRTRCNTLFASSGRFAFNQANPSARLALSRSAAASSFGAAIWPTSFNSSAASSTRSWRTIATPMLKRAYEDQMSDWSPTGCQRSSARIASS